MKASTTKGSIAQQAYDRITEMLRIDNGFDDLEPGDRMKQRQLILQDKVDDYFAWEKEKHTQVTHNSAIGRALAYSINQESYLPVFLSDGEVPMDNNLAEQAIRPFTIGRKNFVMIKTDNGAKASTMIYSIIETAKANNLIAMKYLELLLTVIPNHLEDTDRCFLDALLPWSSFVRAHCLSKSKKS